MDNTFLRNLKRGFGLSLIVLLISSVASYISIQTLSNRAELVNHTNVILQQSEKVASLLKDAETGQRGYLLTGHQLFLRPYIKSRDNIFLIIDSLDVLTRDNAVQQSNLRQLRQLIRLRINKLDQLVRMQDVTNKIDTSGLLEGQQIMDQTKQLVANIQSEEQRLLVIRSQAFSFLAMLTPIIIVISSVLALIITFIFYRKVKSDYDIRVELQKTLENNERQMAKRIEVVEEVAYQISTGNFKVRVTDDASDNLGRLAVALNKMATDLEASFEDYTHREWLKNGAAIVNEKMIGETDMKTLSQNVVTSVAEYSHSQAAAMYIFENEMLHFAAGYALSAANVKSTLALGDGLVGQCAQTQKMSVLNNVPQNTIVLSHAAGEVKPSNIVVFPLVWDGELKGVLETVSIEPYTPTEIEFFNTISSNIGLSIESARQHEKLQELLGETQAQAEELQVQQHELEQLNSELENQAQKLQVSEEELKVQQEELLQANQELEERSAMLEEKNQTILERNLDIQRKADELEASTRYKSEFMANMSHELRTPLNSILLLSRLLAENTEKTLTKEQVEFATVIQNSGNGLLNLIDEILDLSKIEAGKMKVEFRDVAVKEVVSNMQALFAPLAKEKNLPLTFETAPGAAPVIHTDSVRLEQILKNLLSNALKFTSRGSVTLSISPVDGGKIKFVVSDTGIGVAPEKLHLIFEAFQQADGSTRRKYGGTGLGLSISRELAKLLGGDIAVESEHGKGSTFTLTIPVKAENNEAVKPQLLPAIAPVPKPELPEKVMTETTADDSMAHRIADDRHNINPHDKTILIIEDDVPFAQILLSFARQNSYKGLVALRGDHGIQLARQYRPTAILLDIKLPVKDGWEVMDELKADGLTRHIPVHMMSSMPNKEESLSKGAIDFIEKPATLDRLPGVFQSIEKALNDGPRKILIVEENEKHAQALCYFLESYNINVRGTQQVREAVSFLQKGSADCVVLEMKIFEENTFEQLNKVKQNPGLEHLPIIIFTGKSLSKPEELRIKQVADSIVVKTANSYKRILDEIDVFFKIVEENDAEKPKLVKRRLGALEQVLENKTVLIADDDVRNIYSLTKALEAHKMNVLTATDGKDALQQLKQNPKVNIILVDMMMPEMDGYAATRAIRKMEGYRNIPILAVTAKAMYGDREKCIQAGASDYISKPIDIDQLVSLLRVWLYQ